LRSAPGFSYAHLCVSCHSISICTAVLSSSLPFPCSRYLAVHCLCMVSHIIAETFLIHSSPCRRISIQFQGFSVPLRVPPCHSAACPIYAMP
jgi:hypothetical protein